MRAKEAFKNLKLNACVSELFPWNILWAGVIAGIIFGFTLGMGFMFLAGVKNGVYIGM
jgi:hypothetical protein